MYERGESIIPPPTHPIRHPSAVFHRRQFMKTLLQRLLPPARKQWIISNSDWKDDLPPGTRIELASVNFVEGRCNYGVALMK